MEKTITNERIFKYYMNKETYYILETRYNVGEENEELVSDVLDPNFNRLAMLLGRRHNLVEQDRLNELKKQGKDVFLGKASPISIICDSVVKNIDLDGLRAIWERPTEKQVKHYKALLRVSSERLVAIDNEGKQYYIHFASKLHVDENRRGELIEVETFDYLDENFNRFIINISNDRVEHFAKVIGEKAKEQGREIFVGAHSPEIEDVNGDYVPNTDPNTVGIWEKATNAELVHFQSMLNSQNRMKKSIKLVH